MLPRWLAGLALALLAQSAAAELRVSGAWIREPPPVATPLVGYLRIENSGPAERVLVAVRSARAGSIEIHRTLLVDGVSRMQRLATLRIPAGGAVELAPGGAHLMIFGVEEVPRAGDELEMTLEFADGGCLPVRFAVVPSAGVRGARSGDD